MRIGQLSEKSGVPVETIRYYEKVALISEPERDDNNYRKYTPRHLERLLFIRNCRAFDMTHEEIHQLISATETSQHNCDPINEIVAKHIDHIENRICELQALKKTLIQIQATCTSEHAPNQCTILEGLNSMNLEILSAKKTHLS